MDNHFNIFIFLKMYWNFIILLLMNFIIQSFEHFFLIIPYKIYMRNNQRTYRFFTKRPFERKKDLFTNVLQDYKYVPKAYVLFKLDGLFNETRFIDTRNVGYYERYHKEGVESLPFKQSKYLIKLGQMMDKVMFVCNSGFYPTYKLATICVEDLAKFSKIKSEKSYLGKDQNGKRIWYVAWQNCHFECFSKRNYEDMKPRLLKELNMYRALLRARPVIYNEKIEKQAQKQSELNIRPNEFSQVMYKNQLFREISGINSPPLGSTQMNRWYNDYVRSNKNPRLRKAITKFEEALFSPNTKEVGFGVTKKGNKLIIVCRFR
ncbi:CAP domain-containing protein [Strongyloides ratti]|uniref:CAP domain-containing protein n=1 Tax=Strongyloides ratti TaxID=34506 RepID=A0A090MY52_STRRB|nr:CAP domain-containing protein [Strongyloides ratti]CEF66579.2 CAP domain-containing protein [Strongyloides ratti]